MKKTTKREKPQNILTQLEIAEILDTCVEIYNENTPEGRSQTEQREKEVAEKWSELINQKLS